MIKIIVMGVVLYGFTELCSRLLSGKGIVSLLKEWFSDDETPNAPKEEKEALESLRKELEIQIDTAKVKTERLKLQNQLDKVLGMINQIDSK